MSEQTQPHSLEFADCPVWGHFLGSILPDRPKSIQLLREWMGYLISGDTHHHKMMTVLGPVRSGKGIIARIIMEVMGNDTCISLSLAQLGEKFGLESAIGKTAAIVMDCRARSPYVIPRLLSMIHMESQFIQRKRKDEYIGVIAARFTLFANDIFVNDTSGALQSRMLRIYTQKSLDCDSGNFLDCLVPEIVGIRHWAIAGYAGNFTDNASEFPPESS